MDMGIIASIKVGYKYSLLHKLLSVFDDVEQYESVKLAIPTARRGCKGIMYGLIPHILDCMNILDDVWKGERYCSNLAIGRCWRKANCLPLPMQQQLITEYGSADRNIYKISDDDLASMCNLMSTLCIKVRELSAVPDIVSGITEMSSFTSEQRASAVELWCNVENDPLVVETEIEEAMERFESFSISPQIPMVDDHCQTDTNIDPATSSKVTLNQFNDAMRVVYDFTMGSSDEDADALHHTFVKAASEVTKRYLEKRKRSSSQRTIQHFYSVQRSNST